MNVVDHCVSRITYPGIINTVHRRFPVPVLSSTKTSRICHRIHLVFHTHPNNNEDFNRIKKGQSQGQKFMFINITFSEVTFEFKIYDVLSKNGVENSTFGAGLCHYVSRDPKD
jgi:hypothetical protein